MKRVYIVQADTDWQDGETLRVFDTEVKAKKWGDTAKYTHKAIKIYDSDTGLFVDSWSWLSDKGWVLDS